MNQRRLQKETLLFTSTKAFSGFSVDDVPEAKKFYSETLGLRVSEEYGMLSLHIAGEWDILVYPKSDHTPATFTILNSPVDRVFKRPRRQRPVRNPARLSGLGREEYRQATAPPQTRPELPSQGWRSGTVSSPALPWRSPSVPCSRSDPLATN